ncbi:MAG: glycosyltransferase [Patescibacteria group bacterium]|nr:glycosyltransferase [Patescibacteria group bacterium]
MIKYKETYLLKPDSWKDIVSKVAFDVGLPEISFSLGVYFESGEDNFELKFLNSQCFFKVYGENSKLDNNIISLFDDTPLINIENRNIKFFLRSLYSLGLSKAYISGKVINVKFKSNGGNFIDLNLNTPLGDLLILRAERANKYLSNKLVEKKLGLADIKRAFKKVIKSESIFGDLNILNNKIISYANEFGIDLASSGRTSIEDRMVAKSNDYSDYESVYKVVIGSNINSDSKEPKTLKKFFKPASIIIPCFNSNETIAKTLNSIESQAVDGDSKKLLDVIIIDDGSRDPVSRLLRFSDFSFNINLVRLEKNKGIANARNIGVSLAKYDHLIFIDSDILLANNYLSEHSVALQMFPSALFVSMKNNIERNSGILSIKNIKGGLAVPAAFDDKRLVKSATKDQPWINEVKFDGVYEVLSETDCFKLFGNKKMIGGYDLSSAVVSHNMSISKGLTDVAGGFSQRFIGWGLEDTYFGSRVIASGGFIIPLLKTGVYHIKHKPRSGSILKQAEEYKENIKIYKSLIEQEL